MSKCFKCKKRGNFSYHHIDGMGSQLPIDKQNNNSSNLISLCPACHDIIEGICSKCFVRNNCNKNKFKECWGFEDSLPPIHFRTIEDIFEENLFIEKSYEAHCPKCGSDNIIRISKWTYDGVYKHSSNWIAIYRCSKCNKKFSRVLNNLCEKSIDIKKIPIEISDWNLSFKNKV